MSRRTSHWIFGTGHVLSQAIIIFVPTFFGRAFGYALMGMMTAKNINCFTWLFEIMVKENKSWANTSINMIDFMTLIVGGVYFLSGNTNWAPLCYGYFSASVVCYLTISLFCTESPKWLLLQGRREEAIQSLNFIAKVNRSPNRIPEDAMFVECAMGANLENNQSYNLNQSVLHGLSTLSLRATKIFEPRHTASTPK